MWQECLTTGSQRVFFLDGYLNHVHWGGPKKEDRETVIRRDLKDVEINEDEWYEEVVETRAGWRATCKLGVELLTSC